MKVSVQQVINRLFALFFFDRGVHTWLDGFRVPLFTTHVGSGAYFYFSFFIFFPALMLFIVYKAGLGIANKHRYDKWSFTMLGFTLFSMATYLLLLKLNVFTMN